MRAAERGLDTVRPDSWKGEAQVCAVADGGSEELEGEEEEESTTEKRKPAKMVDPIKPSASEVEEHELTHLPLQKLVLGMRSGSRKERSASPIDRGEEDPGGSP